MDNVRPISAVGDFMLFGCEDAPERWPVFGPDPHGFYWKPTSVARGRKSVPSLGVPVSCPTRDLTFVRCDWANIIDGELVVPAISEG